MPRSTQPSRLRIPAQTRRRLLQAAIRLFSARGYHGVSVDEIVAAAGANKRMVYHYFGSKSGLYAAALVEVFGRLERVEFEAVRDAAASPEEKVRQLLAANFRFLDRNPEFVRLLLWENLERGRHIPRGSDRLSKNPFIERFQLVVDEGIAQGRFRPPKDIRHLLVNFIGLCFVYYSNRYSLAASVGVGTETARDRSLRVAQATDLVLHGLVADGPERRAGRHRKA